MLKQIIYALRLAVYSIIIVSISFLSGAFFAISKRGDWLPIKQASGECAGFSPKTQEVLGSFQKRPDGPNQIAYCHMSDFVLTQLFN